jgi:hypothetical protein
VHINLKGTSGANFFFFFFSTLPKYCPNTVHALIGKNKVTLQWE